MRLKTLKSKLLVAVSALVVGSGLLISLLVSERYGNSLRETMNAQAERLAHAVALEAADKILINDLVVLQKMLSYQVHSNSAIAYLFISRDDQILAHTFTKAVPQELIKANDILTRDQAHFQKINSTAGEYYLDIAWPIFAGKAGVLRLGFSEKLYRRQGTSLWLQIGILTLAILLLAISGTLFFVRRFTRPLAALVRATQKVDQGELNVQIQVQGEDEIATLASSFNHMVARMEEYIRQLEEQTMDLERAHQQTRTTCGIVQEIGSMRRLRQIGSFLIKRLQDIMKCSRMLLLIFNENGDTLYLLSDAGFKTLKDSEAIQTAKAAIAGKKKITFSRKAIFRPPIVPVKFQSASRQAIVLLQNENQLLGALVIACLGECRCNAKEVEVVDLILNQAAGVIKRAVLHEEEIRDLEHRYKITAGYSGIIGKDPKMQAIYRLIEDIAPTDATVLIQGESGTGKELVAQAIHRQSLRRDKPFIVINCSAYPATLLESEIFGHEKGAFTGAIRQKSGRFEQASGGTVFLDEIGEIPSSAQIKLLRVLQTQKFERVGGEKTLTVDVRILSATNKNLIMEVRKGNFREDLFYRLNVIPINLPLLRERQNDIFLLANRFLRHFAAENGKKIREFSAEATRLLLDYPWPGNVRELENSIEHAVLLARGGKIEASDLPAIFHTPTTIANADQLRTLAEHEREFLQKALEKCGLNKKLTAQRLKISRNTLYMKLKKYQIISPTLQ